MSLDRDRVMADVDKIFTISPIHRIATEAVQNIGNDPLAIWELHDLLSANGKDIVFNTPVDTIFPFTQGTHKAAESHNMGLILKPRTINKPSSTHPNQRETVPFTLKELSSVFSTDLNFYGKQLPALFQEGWYNPVDQRYLELVLNLPENLQTEWRLVSKEPLPESFGKEWEEQLALLKKQTQPDIHQKGLIASAGTVLDLVWIQTLFYLVSRDESPTSVRTSTLFDGRQIPVRVNFDKTTGFKISRDPGGADEKVGVRAFISAQTLHPSYPYSAPKIH